MSGVTTYAIQFTNFGGATATLAANRERIRQIALDNFHVHVVNSWKLQVPPEPQTFQHLSQIRVPTLVILGERDVRPADSSDG